MFCMAAQVQTMFILIDQDHSLSLLWQLNILRLCQYTEQTQNRQNIARDQKGIIFNVGSRTGKHRSETIPARPACAYTLCWSNNFIRVNPMISKFITGLSTVFLFQSNWRDRDIFTVIPCLEEYSQSGAEKAVVYSAACHGSYSTNVSRGSLRPARFFHRKADSVWRHFLFTSV